MAVNNICNSGIASNSNASKAQFEVARARINEEALKTNVEGRNALTKARADSVTLTEQAQSFSEIQKKIKNSPDINQSKVESIKKAVLDGTYEIDSVTIANKMVDFERELDFIYNYPEVSGLADSTKGSLDAYT